jgi:hypothetical protein
LNHLKDNKSPLRIINKTSFIFVLVFAVFVLNDTLGATEILKYDLKWLGIKAGTAKLSFIDEGTKVRIISEARSASWVSVFYKVEDRAESVVRRAKDTGILIADRYRIKIHEGRHRRDKEVIFFPEEKKAKYIDHLNKEEKFFEVPEGVLDPLSGFLALRNKEIKGEGPLWIVIFDSKKVWRVKVNVIGREVVRTKAGEFNTIVVKPELHSEGIFNRKGDVYIYLTDDERHIPVLLKTEIVVGYVVAELVGIYY